MNITYHINIQTQHHSKLLKHRTFKNPDATYTTQRSSPLPTSEHELSMILEDIKYIFNTDVINNTETSLNTNKNTENQDSPDDLMSHNYYRNEIFQMNNKISSHFDELQDQINSLSLEVTELKEKLNKTHINTRERTWRVKTHHDRDKRHNHVFIPAKHWPIMPQHEEWYKNNAHRPAYN